MKLWENYPWANQVCLYDRLDDIIVTVKQELLSSFYGITSMKAT